MKGVRSPMLKMQAMLDNKDLEIKALQKENAELRKRLEAAHARNRDLRELLSRQASELVAKDRSMQLLRQQLQN